MKITKVEAIPIRQKTAIQAINDSSQDGLIVRIQTDAGDEVEALCGFGNLVSVTYIAESNTMVVTLTRKADSGVGAALDALGAENVRLRTENTKMSEHINQLEDCILELSDSVYGEETAE